MEEALIVNMIYAHVKHNASDYYVGITNSPHARLLAHEVPYNDTLIFDAMTELIARQIERHFVNTVGTKGGTGGGAGNSHFVYYYKITTSTKQDT